MADCVVIHLWLRPRRRTQVLAFRPWRRRRAACGAGALAGLEAERQGACQAGAIARTWTRIAGAARLHFDGLSSTLANFSTVGERILQALPGMARNFFTVPGAVVTGKKSGVPYFSAHSAQEPLQNWPKSS